MAIGAVAKYLHVSLGRTLSSVMWFVLDCSFFYEPPMHWIKTGVLNVVGSGKLARDTFVASGVRVRGLKNVTTGSFSCLLPGATIDARCEVSIGSGTTISRGVLITNGDHDVESLCPYGRAVRIGNGVFIGARATIIRGVSIGDHTIVGAGAVVTKDLPPYSICVGAPARVIRTRARPREVWTVFGVKPIDVIERAGSPARPGAPLPLGRRDVQSGGP